MENSREQLGLECMEIINRDACYYPMGAIKVQGFGKKLLERTQVSENDADEWYESHRIWWRYLQSNTVQSRGLMNKTESLRTMMLGIRSKGPALPTFYLGCFIWTFDTLSCLSSSSGKGWESGSYRYSRTAHKGPDALCDPHGWSLAEHSRHHIASWHHILCFVAAAFSDFFNNYFWSSSN